MSQFISRARRFFLPIVGSLVAFGAPVHGASPREAAREDRMERWRSYRYGLFIQWGPSSKLGGYHEGKAVKGAPEGIMKSAPISRDVYRNLAEGFDPKQYDPSALVAFAKESGFKYIVMTAKYHDGFALFDSKHDDFDAVDVLPSRRDLLKEFSTECSSAGMPLGFFYAAGTDWYHQGGDVFALAKEGDSRTRFSYLEKVALPQVRELLANYGPVSEVIFDRLDGVPPELLSRFKEALGPGIVCATDFGGRERGDHHFTGEGTLGANFSGADWEKVTLVGDSLGFRQDAGGWKSGEAIIRDLVSTATRGGNLMLGVGLDGDGLMPGGAQEGIRVAGKWLGLHGKSIYGTLPSPFVVHPWEGGATVGDDGKGGSILYIHLFKSPGSNLVLRNLLTKPGKARLMGSQIEIPISGRAGDWRLDLSGLDLGGMVPVLEIQLPSAPSMGRGLLSQDPDGNYPLAFSRATYSSEKMRVGRTQSSAKLRLLGFGDRSESGTWELHAERPGPVRLNLKAEAEAEVSGKQLVLSLNGRAIDTFGESPGVKDTPGIRNFVSKAFELPAGSNSIVLSGAESDASTPLRVLEISLIKD